MSSSVSWNKTKKKQERSCKKRDETEEETRHDKVSDQDDRKEDRFSFLFMLDNLLHLLDCSDSVRPLFFFFSLML